MWSQRGTEEAFSTGDIPILPVPASQCGVTDNQYAQHRSAGAEIANIINLTACTII